MGLSAHRKVLIRLSVKYDVPVEGSAVRGGTWDLFYVLQWGFMWFDVI